MKKQSNPIPKNAKRPKPPAAPPMVNKEISMPEYLHKIDTSTPGVYVARLNKEFPQEVMLKIRENFISILGKDSKILLLSSSFEPVFIPDDKTMERLGFFRKT